MSKLSEIGDRTGRVLRDTQIQTLNWIDTNWKTGKHLAISAPVGAGKSLIAKTLFNEFHASIVTPSNVLVQQYTKTYPDIPFYIASTNYHCASRAMKCATIIDTFHSKACDNCAYAKCKVALQTSKPMLFNPISLFHARRQNDFLLPHILVIDEAHAVLSLLRTLNSEKFFFNRGTLKDIYNIDTISDLKNEIYLIQFLQIELCRVKKEFEEQSTNWNTKKRAKKNKKIITIENILLSLQSDPQLLSIQIEGFSLTIRCVKLPKSILKRVFGNARLILLSASLFKTDLEELLQEEPYELLDLPSPIPKENRRIFYKPTKFKINYLSNPKDIAQEIEAIIIKHPKVNTLVHLPYSLAARVVKELTIPVITHDRDDKDQQLALWLRVGGVFVGSGVTEGLDLIGDLCRLNILVKIPYPNLGDALVKKRRALSDGESWYDAESLKPVIQAVGRSTRSETDWSYTYILDPSLARLVYRNNAVLPTSFTESIIWSNKHD